MSKRIYGKLGKSVVIHNPSHKVVEAQALIEMEGLPEDSNAIAQEDGTWAVTNEVIAAQYAAKLATLDPMLSHALRHERNGDTERAERAWLELDIAQAKIMENYGKGETVLITEGGECYHTDRDCTGLANAVNVMEINKSDGLENYSPCSICCN